MLEKLRENVIIDLNGTEQGLKILNNFVIAALYLTILMEVSTKNASYNLNIKKKIKGNGITEKGARMFQKPLLRKAEKRFSLWLE